MPTTRLSRRTFMALAALPALKATRSLCAAEPPALRFGVAADAQYMDHDTRGVRHYRMSLGKLAACVDDFNTKPLDFTIHLGDFIDQRFESFDDLMPIWNRLTMPKYHVLGNHDFAVAAAQRDQVPAKLGMPSRYYDFGVKGWRFIVLDTMDVSFLGAAKGSAKRAQAKAIQQKLKAAKAVNSVTWNGALGAEQMAWLKGRLDAATQAGERVILFAHMPVAPPNVHNLWNDAGVLGLIDAYPCVAAYINGHNHHGNYAERKRVHYLTIQGMVDTTRNAYGVVEVYADQLKVIGTGRCPSRTLKLG